MSDFPPSFLPSSKVFTFNMDAKHRRCLFILMPELIFPT